MDAPRKPVAGYHCRRCGRRITTEKALQRGYGAICWMRKFVQQELPFEELEGQEGEQPIHKHSVLV